MATPKKKRPARPAQGGLGIERPAAEVVQIYKGKVPRLYIEEHMEARGLDVPMLAHRLEQHEKSVYRSLREPSRIWKEIELWAFAIGVDDWRDLTLPPGRESVDKIIVRSLDGPRRD